MNKWEERMLALLSALRSKATIASASPLLSPAAMPTDDIEHLLQLPEELLISIVLHLCSSPSGVSSSPSGVSAALRLSATSKWASDRLQAVKRQVEAAHRMRWSTDNPHVHKGALTITETGNSMIAATGKQWKHALGSALPMAGRSTWGVRISHSKGGYLQVGVATEDGSVAWSLALYRGHAWCASWDAASGTMVEAPAPPPEGYPRLQPTPVLLDDGSTTARLQSDASGALIMVTMDHDAGTLSFRVLKEGGDDDIVRANDEQVVVGGFPTGAVLRPCVALYDKGDRVVIQGC